MRLRNLVLVLAASSFLGACSMFGPLGDTVSGWFSGPSKSELKGERISVMTLDEAVQPDPALSSKPVVLPPPYLNPEWPEPGGYASNAMYHLQARGGLHQVWSAEAGKGSDTDSRLTSSPIVAGGRVYVLDSQAHIFAFDARTGSGLWNVELAPRGKDESYFFGMLGDSNTINPAKGFGGGVAFEAGRVFVTTGFGDVFALDAATGRQIWKTNLGVPIVNAPVANGGRVFVSSEDNHFYALAQIDGRKLWDHQGIAEAAGILESTSAAVAGEFVIAPYTSGELFALRVQNGRPAWNDMLTRSGTVTALSELDDIAARPVVDRDLVFAISHSGIMAAINLATGDRIWSRYIGGIQTPWAAGDFLYVMTSEDQMLCLQRKDGAVKWIYQLPRWEDKENKKHPIVWSGPVLVSDRLIAVSSTGMAASISPYTGAYLGEMKLSAGTSIAPIVANNTMYILTQDAELLALR
ncbi:MAG TPA: PQQ-binding-like beta-propeller repeat protein [Rhizomicrobium sp.]